MTVLDLKKRAFSLLEQEADARVIEAVVRLLEHAPADNPAEYDFADGLTPEQLAAIEQGTQQAQAGLTKPWKNVLTDLQKQFSSTDDIRRPLLRK